MPKTIGFREDLEALQWYNLEHKSFLKTPTDFNKTIVIAELRAAS